MATAAVGDTLTCTITVTNHGTGDANVINVAARDVLPAGVALVSFDIHGQGPFDPSTVTWSLPLPAGATFILTLVVTVLPSAAGHTLTNVLIVDPPPGSGSSMVEDPCPNDPTESCATTSVAVEAVHPVEIVTDLGPPTGSTQPGGLARLAWVLGGGLLVLIGAVSLALTVRRPRGKYARSRPAHSGPDGGRVAGSTARRAGGHDRRRTFLQQGPHGRRQPGATELPAVLGEPRARRSPGPIGPGIDAAGDGPVSLGACARHPGLRGARRDRPGRHRPDGR